MKRNEAVTINADNLSRGWAQVIEQLTQRGVSSLSPVVLSISFDGSGTIEEVPAIRHAVDRFLMAQGKRSTENVAWTIFPERYLKLAKGDRALFYDLFNRAFRRVRRFNPRNNRRGSYFQRLIDYNDGGRGPNQLEWIINEYHTHPKARRRSKYQATMFDPERDQTSAGQLEFPCLQQISFTFDDGELRLNAFYATQQIARKAYGNYLGLAQLGVFMAREMGMRLVQLNVFIGMAKMDVSRNNADFLTMLAAVRKAAAEEA
jgi:hypothetical protein